MIQRRRVTPAVPRPPLTPAEAGERIGRIADLVSKLTAVIVEETRLVRAGAYDAAGALAPTKGELSSRYMLDVDGLATYANALATQPPENLEEVERLHVGFRAALDENLLVLGTARSVAESLMRGVAEEVAAKAAPKTYDSRGGGEARPPAAPITLSRGA